MEKETSIRSRRVAAKARERRKRRQILLVGITGVVLLVVLSIFVFVSCGKEKYEADTNTVYILEDGKIVSINVEPFDEATYAKEELEDYIQKAVDTYNSKNGEASVTKEALEVNENTAKLILEYADVTAFQAFEDTELFCGSIADALEAGYTFEGTFVSVADGKTQECSAEAFMNDAEYKVVIMKKDTTVCIEEGTISYVSAENTANVSANSVSIKNNSSLVPIPEEKDTQQGELIEIEPETEDFNDAVGEDELEVGTESEVYFDFGDEPEVEEIQYDDVYTYIIYK